MNKRLCPFAVHHYAFDGEALGSALMQPEQMSDKWLAVADDLLSDGPIFTRSLGSTLSHYEIKCVAGICHFKVSGNPVFFGVLLPFGCESQNEELFKVFAAQLSASPLVKEKCNSTTEFLRESSLIKERPAFIVINWLSTIVAGHDQEAMFQFAYHFAGAYFRWRSVA